MFTAQLKISPPPHIAMPSTDGAALPANIIPAKYFEAVLDSETCSKYQTSVLKNAEVISFSYNPEWSNLHLGDRLHVTGLVVHKYQIRRSNLSDWLVHDGLEVEWRAIIGRRDRDPTALKFLEESALHDDFFAARDAGDTSKPNLRIDRLGPSSYKKTGRPSKRQQPDAGFGDAIGDIRAPLDRDGVAVIRVYPN